MAILCMVYGQSGTGKSTSLRNFSEVDKNNSPCPCASPVTLQVINETAATFTNANIVVTKLA